MAAQHYVAAAPAAARLASSFCSPLPRTEVWHQVTLIRRIFATIVFFFSVAGAIYSGDAVGWDVNRPIRMGLSEFSGLVELADVVLDPFPVGGGRSSFETFAVGTPIVMLYNRTSVLQVLIMKHNYVARVYAK